jgi:hypothetical protein
MISFNLHTSSEALSPNIVTLGLGLQYMYGHIQTCVYGLEGGAQLLWLPRSVVRGRESMKIYTLHFMVILEQSCHEITLLNKTCPGILQTLNSSKVFEGSQVVYSNLLTLSMTVIFSTLFYSVSNESLNEIKESATRPSFWFMGCLKKLCSKSRIHFSVTDHE